MTHLPMLPRTLKLNAHRSLTYYTPEDVTTLQHELSIARQNAELLTMAPRTLQHLLHLNTRLVAGEPLDDQLRAELETTVAALRQQRATTLATSEARISKYNRPVRDVKSNSFAPVYLLIADYKIHISDNQTGDDLANRLVAAWNCCLGVPTQDLLPGHYNSLREREPT